MSSTLAAVQAIQRTVKGESGANAVLYFGRQTFVHPDPTSMFELLTPRARLVHLGRLPASGENKFTWAIPVVLAPGTFLCAQAEVTAETGTLERTNLVPIVVR